MKILMVNKFYYPRRGAEQVFLATQKLLENHGHEVIVFAMKHEQNLPSPYEKYFVSNVVTDKPSLGQGFKAWLRALFSREAAENLEQLIVETKPEVAILHNIYHQISPSILPILKKHKIPVVLVAHDYKLVCPDYQLHQKGFICPTNPWLHAWDSLIHRKHKNSFFSSLALSVEWLYHKLTKIYENNVDLVIAPSRFLARNLVEYGWPEEKIAVVPNFSQLPGAAGPKNGHYVLAVGTTSWEKGLDILLQVALDLPDVNFKLVGDAPAIQGKPVNLDILGKLSQTELGEVYEKAGVLFVPTRLQESFGLTLIEAALYQTPAVAAKIGALPEFVQDNVTGLLFNPSASDAIATAQGLIKKLLADQAFCDELGRNARNRALKYSGESYYLKILELIQGIKPDKRS